MAVVRASQFKHGRRSCHAGSVPGQRMAAMTRYRQMTVGCEHPKVGAGERGWGGVREQQVAGQPVTDGIAYPWS